MFKVTPILVPRYFETYADDFSPKLLTSKELEAYSETHRYFRVETIRYEKEEQANQEFSAGSED